MTPEQKEGNELLWRLSAARWRQNWKELVPNKDCPSYETPPVDAVVRFDQAWICDLLLSMGYPVWLGVPRFRCSYQARLQDVRSATVLVESFG